MPAPFARTASQTRPTFSRDFAGLKTLDHGAGPAITFTRASNATFFNAAGTLTTATTNEPRFDHDPATGASRGLLIEESRTNSIRNSQAGGATNGVIGSGGVVATNWSAQTISGLTTQVVGSGTQNGMSYVDIRYSGTNASASVVFPSIVFEIETQVAASSGQTWTGSFYAAIAGGTTSGINSIRADVYESTAAGSFLANSNTTHTLTSSLARYSHTRTLTEATTGRVSTRILLFIAGSATIDLTLRIAAPQLEQGAFPTSYIPTTTAAATRSADSAVVTPISSFYNQAEGTLFAEASTTSWTANSLMTVVAFDQSTNASDNVFRIIRNGTFGASPNNKLISVYRSGAGPDAAALASADGTWAFNVVARVASAYKVNDFAASLNGGAVLTDTSGALTTMNRMWLGNWAMNEISNGHIRKIAYYPRRLSNTLLQQLTT